MSRDRLCYARPRIAIPIMLPTVPDELTAQSLNRLDEIDSLHDTTSSSTRRIPGIVPLVTSW